MSITSFNQKPTNNQFSDLLTRYPRLAAWLVEMLQSRIEPQAEALMPSFLHECANQDILEDAYPFTCEDCGLADLRVFLHSAQEELNPHADHVAPSLTSIPAASASQLVPDEIDVSPVVPEVVGMPDEIDVTPVMRQSGDEPEVQGDLYAQTVDPSAGITEKIPVVSNQDTSWERVHQENSERLTESEAGPGSAKQEDELAQPALSETEAVLEEQATGPLSEVASVAEEARKQQISLLETPKPVPVVSRKQARIRRPRTRKERLVSLTLLIVILATILVPAGFLLNFGISAYTTYHELSDQAHSAVNHLLNVKNIFSGSKSHLSGIFDTTKLQQAQKEFAASGHDFQQLQNQLQHSSTLNTVVTYLPQYREMRKSAEAASAIGIDVAAIGQIAIARAASFAPLLSGPLLSVSKKPLVTQPMLDTIGSTLDQVLPLLDDIQAHAQDVSLSTLPLSDSQKAQIGPLLQLLPQVVSDLGQVRNLLGSAGWLLGVDQPRTFLVQTMDRAELRATGGFTGQYGELGINGGRVAPFSLKDISLVEYTNTSVTQGQLAPTQYRSWWPFANWGLRDSNVSADFPTTAQLALQLYQQEVGHSVDGVISFTPVAIEHILAIIGPVNVPGYNTSATAQNLEDLLHYYQLDNSGIYKQILTKQPNDDQTSTRKRFTNLLASLLMSKVRSAPPDQLLAIAHQVLYDLKTKDLQIYFTDPAIEGLLMQYGYAGQMNRSLTHDGLYVVQENLSATKASQYTQTIMHDTVTLNSQGGATHVLQVRLVYNQAGPVYGYDTYYDYMRVYVPPNSKLLWGDGFATNTPLCGGRYGDCPANGVYPGGELSCPSGQYQPGATPPNLSGSDGATWLPLRTIGGPTNTISDEPGRAMYGGWVIIPKNCTMNVTLSWYVPPLSQQPYTLLVQRQAGTFPDLDLTILPNAANCARLRTSGLHVNDILVEDSSFTPQPSPKQGTQGCYPKQGA